MISILSKSFSSFLSEINLNLYYCKPKDSIISFIYDISEIYNPNSRKRILSSNKSFFYSDSNNEYEIYASGLCISVSEDDILDFEDIRNTELLTKRTSYISSILHRNWTECCSEFIPLIIGGLKFNSKNTEKWKNFKYCEWYIPELMIFTTNQQDKKNFRTYILVNFRFETTSEFENLKTRFNKLIENLTENENIDNSLNAKMQGVFGSYIETIDVINNNIAEYNSWESLVKNGKSSIEKGETEKIVLAREVSFKVPDFVISDTIEFLISKFNGKKNKNNCNLYLLKTNDSLYFGCSPEKLFSAKGNSVETEAVAGSSARSGNEKEDNKSEIDLIGSEKDNKEHEYVVNFILNSLKELSEEINYSSTPKIKKLTNLLHLWTPIEAKLRRSEIEETHLLPVYKLISRLFPTPAVCGFPLEKSYQTINEIEEFERGLYSGIVGWFNFHAAHITVSIRGILINKNEISIYAGCGIVEDSLPKNEFEETILKIKNILKILDYES